MNWHWKSHFYKNSIKVAFHIVFEASILAGWYIALEGDPYFWPLGIASAFIVHVAVFTKIDLLHEYHHHHNGDKGHSNHKASKHNKK